MSWYHMKVLRDGEPAPKTLLLQEFLAPNTTGIYVGSELLETVPPKGQVSFDVHLELYFDLSAPGKYEITFDNGVETSNTLVGLVTETGGTIQIL